MQQNFQPERYPCLVVTERIIHEFCNPSLGAFTVCVFFPCDICVSHLTVSCIHTQFLSVSVKISVILKSLNVLGQDSLFKMMQGQ